MGVLLKKRKNTDGSTTLFLVISYDGTRKYEFLTKFKLPAGNGPADREARRNNLAAAELIRSERSLALAKGEYNIPNETGKKTDVVAWMDAFVLKYKKKDIRIMQGAVKNFKKYLEEAEIKQILFKDLTEDIIIDFRGYLSEKFKHEGPATYFKRFKRILKTATKKLNLPNPAQDVNALQGFAKNRDTLTLDEIKTLAATTTESPEVRRAFLFTCMTGLRWCDVKILKWENINGNEAGIYQSKTNQFVPIRLNDTAMKLLEDRGKPGDLVFNLPTANGANKTLDAWVKRAGIGKKITWHNGRHSYGTNLAFLETDILTIGTLMGHASLKYTTRYTRAAEHLKQAANDKLNIEL